MYIVTGGAGFIGSNLVKALNKKGINDIIVVDDLTDGAKYKNIVDCNIKDYIDKDVLLTKIQDSKFIKQVKIIFHQGACSTTTEWDGRYMMNNNYEYSKDLFHCCISTEIPFIYASSAAVYGLTDTFVEEPKHESPLNVYGYSKLQFDRYVRQYLPTLKSQVVGLRYFNVFGPGEYHKGSMASVIFHFYKQLLAQGVMKLFAANDNYDNGEQRRDFIYVNDIVDVILWFADNKHAKGIYNVGTGKSRSFNDVAAAVLNYHGSGKIEYIPFPDHLKGHYQSFTEADITLLKNAGYQQAFTSLENAVEDYLKQFQI